MIFVDKIDNTIKIAKYLYSNLFKRIQKKKYLNHIIRRFMTNFTNISRTKFLPNLDLDETQIQCYTKCMGMGIDLLDICRII